MVAGVGFEPNGSANVYAGPNEVAHKEAHKDSKPIKIGCRRHPPHPIAGLSPTGKKRIVLFGRILQPAKKLAGIDPEYPAKVDVPDEVQTNLTRLDLLDRLAAEPHPFSQRRLRQPLPLAHIAYVGDHFAILGIVDRFS